MPDQGVAWFIVSAPIGEQARQDALVLIVLWWASRAACPFDVSSRGGVLAHFASTHFR